MKTIWAKFEQFFKSQGKSLSELGFRSGANAKAIDDAEIHLSATFPMDFRELLLMNNGQKENILDWLPDHMTLFGIDEIVQTWDYELSIMPKIGEHTFNTFHFHDKIRALIFHRERIPIAQYELGACEIYFDFIPGPKGVEGQLIFNITEADFIVLTDTFHELIAHYVDFLEDGDLVFSKNPKGSESKYALKTKSGKSINGNIWLELIK